MDRKQDSKRRVAKLAARKLHRWIGRALAKQVCPVCGDTLSHEGCACGSLVLDPNDFLGNAQEEV